VKKSLTQRKGRMHQKRGYLGQREKNRASKREKSPFRIARLNWWRKVLWNRETMTAGEKTGPIPWGGKKKTGGGKREAYPRGKKFRSKKKRLVSAQKEEKLVIALPERTYP